MDNNLNEKDLIIKVQEIWSKNKKSEELIKYFEILLSQKQDIDVELYLIYLNTLVNQGKHSKALLQVENNDRFTNAKEVVAFKIRLLFFLKKYKECEAYIKNVTLDEDNKVLAQRTLNQIKQKYPEKEVKEKIKSDKEAKTEFEAQIPKEEINTSSIENKKVQVRKEENVIYKENNKKIGNKSKLKLIVPVVVIILLGAGMYLLSKYINKNVALETFINLDNGEDLSQYKSGKTNVDYRLPIGKEFEFVSSVESSNKNKQIYITYKVSDENIATITENGFFKGKKEGIVDIQTLNKNKVVDTITIEVINQEVAKGKTTEEVETDYSYEWEIQEFIQQYEKDYIKAVNEGDYNIVKKYLVKGGPLDNEHSTNIKDFHKKGIKERLESLQFLSVDKISDVEYIANVKETIAIIKDGEEKIKEFDAFYNVIFQDNGEYLISEMQIRAINEISSKIDEHTQDNLKYNDKDIATERAKEIAKSAEANLLNSEDTLVDYDGRKCWQFYIGMGDARVEILYIDIETGEFKESINSSLDWRYEW